MPDKCKKCNFINCGKINKYALLMLVEAGLNISLSFVIFESKTIYYPVIYPVLIQIIGSLGSTLSFILIIIYHIRNKRKNNKINQHLIKKDDKIERSWKKKILWILLVPIFTYITIFLDCFIAINGVNYQFLFGFYFVFLTLFSKLLLKNKPHKHHYLCIIIMIILDLLYNAINGVPSINQLAANELSYLPIVICTLFYGLLLVYYKYLMFIKYIKTYEVLFFEGLFLSVLFIITFIILIKTGYVQYFWLYYENIDKKEIIILISFGLICFLIGLFKLIIIDIFSPFHILLTELIPKNLANILVPTDTATYITTISFTVVDIFILFIFVEFIELNFVGLSEMTKRNIEKRARLESLEDDINDITIKKKITLDEYDLELEFKNN